MTAIVNIRELDDLLADLRARAVDGEVTLDQLRWYSNLLAEQRDALMKNEEDEPKHGSAKILRLLPCSPLTVAATDGTETIPNASSVFTGYIDPDFRNDGADEASAATPDTPVVVHEMVKDATFQQMFSSLSAETDRLCLTQSQIIGFVKTHRQHLRTDGNATFFLFKSKGKFFVAYVNFCGDGRLGVRVRRFEHDLVWCADIRLRVVVPQL